MINTDTLIIGAGAAGLAAGRALHDAGQRVLIVEARDRIGGRIWTDTTMTDFPVELGAEFIHGETAATHDLVHQAGLDVIPVERMGKLRWGTPALTREEWPEALRQTIDGLLDDYTQLNLSQGNDLSLADYLRGSGWEAEALGMADVLLAQTCCASLETLSCADLLREMQADHAGKDEFRIRQGYKPLLDFYSQNLPLYLNSPVSEIRWGNEGVTAITDRETFEARQCIITLPVSLLQRGTIRFDPPLSAEKQAAIQAFRMEAATKLIYQFYQPHWDDDLTFMAHMGVAARWWTPGYGRPGAAMIAAYITAERAQEIDSLDEQTALELGLGELETLLGKNLRADLKQARRVSWAHDPYALGGYAHIPPGAASVRTLLAQPESNSLFFAGEATAYDTNPQTVHGALESGWRAAREILAT